MLYVAKLASVFFDGLLESVQEFQRAFAGNPDSSSGEDVNDDDLNFKMHSTSPLPGSHEQEYEY